MGTAELHLASVTSGVEIIEYTKRGLRELLADQHFWTQRWLPITKRRVISQISNPRADDNDTVLITAHHKGQLVAYLGILPDLLKSESQQPMKFGWLTAWWADKGSEHRLAAMKILFAAMKKYPNRLAASSPASEAARVYAGTRQFRECARFDSSYFIVGLPPSFHALSDLARWFAGAKNRLVFGRELANRGLEIRTVQALDGATESFINDWAVGDPLGRDSSYWNWVLRFPWMSASEEDETVQRSYAFSVFAKDFRQIPMFVSRFGTIIAFLFMVLREGRLFLKYAYYNPSDISDVAAALRKAVTDLNPWLLICADTAVHTQLRRGIPFYVGRMSKSSAIYAAKALPSSVACRLQLGSGDSIFA
jgi:hypothetical protein